MNGSVSPPGTFVLPARTRASPCQRDAQAEPARFCGGHGAQSLRLHRARRRQPQLGVTAYGGLYALINAALIAALPAAFVAPVVAQLAAEFRALHDDGHLRGLTDSVAAGFAKLGLVYVVVATLRRCPVCALSSRAGLVGAVRRSARGRRALRQRAARRRARHARLRRIRPLQLDRRHRESLRHRPANRGRT